MSDMENEQAPPAIQLNFTERHALNSFQNLFVFGMTSPDQALKLIHKVAQVEFPAEVCGLYMVGVIQGILYGLYTATGGGFQAPEVLKTLMQYQQPLIESGLRPIDLIGPNRKHFLSTN